MERLPGLGAIDPDVKAYDDDDGTDGEAVLLVHRTARQCRCEQQVLQRRRYDIRNSGAGGVIGCPPSNPFCGGSANFWASDAKDHERNILSAPDQTNWLPWSTFGSTLDNRGDLTPTNIQTEYLYGLPLTARNILSFNDFSSTVSNKGIYNMTQTQYADSFGTLLNRMEYSGSYFGAEKDAVKVLSIGSSDDGIFPQFLTPAVNVTFISSNYPDQNPQPSETWNSST